MSLRINYAFFALLRTVFFCFFLASWYTNRFSYTSYLQKSAKPPLALTSMKYMYIQCSTTEASHPIELSSTEFNIHAWPWLCTYFLPFSRVCFSFKKLTRIIQQHTRNSGLCNTMLSPLTSNCFTPHNSAQKCMQICVLVDEKNSDILIFYITRLLWFLL